MQKCSHVAVLQTPQKSLLHCQFKNQFQPAFCDCASWASDKRDICFWRCDKPACFLAVWQLTSDVRWQPLVPTHSLSTVFSLATPSLHARSSNPHPTHCCAHSCNAQTNRACVLTLVWFSGVCRDVLRQIMGQPHLLISIDACHPHSHTPCGLSLQ